MNWRLLKICAILQCIPLALAYVKYRCIDSDGEYVCSDDPLKLRTEIDGRTVTAGVTQRIDGNEAEKEKIRESLNGMDEYFFNEVLALPEYDRVRHNCKNTNELCAFWASVGECESNRIFMLTNCAAVCRFCLLLHSGLA